MTEHSWEIDITAAIQSAPDDAIGLQSMAASQRQKHGNTATVVTDKQWQPGAGTYTYLSHIAIPATEYSHLQKLAELFYHAASLPEQPWYSQFIRGQAVALDEKPADNSLGYQLTVAEFDFGFSKPRSYRQLMSLWWPNTQCAVIVARSVSSHIAFPAGSVPAYTLGANGEVLFWQDGYLHWHHICTTPGPALLSGQPDRWFMNGLRFLGLDQAERTTYREEAYGLRDWLADKPAFDQFCTRHIPQ